MVQTVERNGASAPVKTRTIAICGTAGSSRDEIRSLDADVEVWGLNQSWKWMPPPARWFEMHDRDRYPTAYSGEHLKWLQEADCPVYMQRRQGDIPNSVTFPVDEVTEGGRLRPLFTSTVAYMLALAIHERPDEIRLLGIDMAMDSEYAYQRAACEYWIGVAEAKGIRVYVPDVSPIGKGIRYGIDPVLTDTRRDVMGLRDSVKMQRDQMLADFVNETAQKLEDLKLNLAGCEGAFQITQRLMQGPEQ